MYTSLATFCLIAFTLCHYAFAGLIHDSLQFAPIYKFDRGAHNYCYPDQPTSENDGTCKSTFSSSTPSFVQRTTCSGYMVYTYWLWYGKQKPCAPIVDSGHGDDWEHVSVWTQGDEVKKVTFHQHSGHYSRKRGEFERDGERVKVYIGKIAHGSYHKQCDGSCSALDVILGRCFNTVRYCPGGCGYWDDFRNPGPTMSAYTVKALKKGQTIAGIDRPDRDICISNCEGSSSRKLTKSGCWQNKV